MCVRVRMCMSDLTMCVISMLHLGHDAEEDEEQAPPHGAAHLAGGAQYRCGGIYIYIGIPAIPVAAATAATAATINREWGEGGFFGFAACRLRQHLELGQRPAILVLLFLPIKPTLKTQKQNPISSSHRAENCNQISNILTRAKLQAAQANKIYLPKARTKKKNNRINKPKKTKTKAKPKVKNLNIKKIIIIAVNKSWCCRALRTHHPRNSPPTKPPLHRKNCDHRY